MRTLRDRQEFYWLDLTDPSTADLDTVGQLITINDLALEDAREFGQRAKLDDYSNSALLVFYGAEERPNKLPRLVEVHLHITEGALVTVTREPLAALDTVRRRVESGPSPSAGSLIYGVLDALADSLLVTLDGFDQTVDELQDVVVAEPTTGNRQRIFALRRQLTDMRQVVVPQRDMLSPVGNPIEAIPNLDDTSRDLIRDVHDHLDRAAWLITTYREQLSSLLDLYLAEVSTRLNEFMKRLSVIATVFLPLSFLVGFFGMNFGWMVGQIKSAWTFLVFGVGLLVLSSLAVGLYLRRSAKS